MRRYPALLALLLAFGFWFYSPVPYPERPLSCPDFNATISAQCTNNLEVRIVSGLFGLLLGATLGAIADDLSH